MRESMRTRAVTLFEELEQRSTEYFALRRKLDETRQAVIAAQSAVRTSLDKVEREVASAH